MIGALKEFVIPLAVWLTVMACFLYGLTHKAHWSLFLFAILSPLPSLWYPTHAFILGKDTMDLLFVSAGLGLWLQRQRTPAPQGTWILAAIVYSYVSVWVVSSTFGFSPPVTRDNPVLADWKNYALMLSWFFVAHSLINSEVRARTLVNIMVGVLLFMCWREISGFVAGSSFSWGRRAEGPFWIVGLNSNHFGAFVAQVGLLALGLAAYEKNRTRKGFYLATAALSLYPLLYSYSRGAYLGFLAGLVLLGALRYRALLLVVLVVAPFWDTLLPDSVIDRVSMTEDPEGELDESAALRIVMWDVAKKLFSGSPVFGIGFHGFVFASADLPLHNVHNYYLQVAAEQGIVGLLLLAMILWLGLSTGWRLWRSGGSDFLRGLGLGVMGYVTCVAVVNVFGDRYSQLALGSTFFLLLGAAVRMRHLAAAPVTLLGAAWAGPALQPLVVTEKLAAPDGEPPRV